MSGYYNWSSHLTQKDQICSRAIGNVYFFDSRPWHLLELCRVACPNNRLSCCRANVSCVLGPNNSDKVPWWRCRAQQNIRCSIFNANLLHGYPCLEHSFHGVTKSPITWPTTLLWQQQCYVGVRVGATCFCLQTTTQTPGMLSPYTGFSHK